MSLKVRTNGFQMWLDDMKLRFALRKFQIKGLAAAAAIFLALPFIVLASLLWLIFRIIFVHLPKLIVSGVLFLFYGSLFRLWLLIFRPRRLPWDLLLVVGLVLSLSVWWSVASEDWVNFQRSGSLVIFIAILAFGLDYRLRIKKAVEAMSDGMADALEDLQRLVAESGEVNLGKEKRYRMVVTELEELKREWEEIDIEVALKAAQRWEFALLLLGTLIWGYGDLIGWFF